MTQLQNLRNSSLFLLYWVIFLGVGKLTNPEPRSKDRPLGTPTLLLEASFLHTGQVPGHSGSKEDIKVFPSPSPYKETPTEIW